jgi:hypothetical protein
MDRIFFTGKGFALGFDSANLGGLRGGDRGEGRGKRVEGRG